MMDRKRIAVLLAAVAILIAGGLVYTTVRTDTEGLPPRVGYANSFYERGDVVDALPADTKKTGTTAGGGIIYAPKDSPGAEPARTVWVKSKSGKIWEYDFEFPM